MRPHFDIVESTRYHAFGNSVQQKLWLKQIMQSTSREINSSNISAKNTVLETFALCLNYTDRNSHVTYLMY